MGEIKQENLKKVVLQRADSGGSSLVSHKTKFQTVGLVLLQCALQAWGPQGNTAAVQLRGGRGRNDFFFFFSFFSDSWSVRSWKIDALNWSLCLAPATAGVGTAGNGLQGTLCLAAVLFPTGALPRCMAFFLGGSR